MSNSPVVTRPKININNKRYRLQQVSFKDSKRKILVIDNNYNLDSRDRDDNPTNRAKNTFTTLCYEVASTLRKNVTFIYAETRGMTSPEISELIAKIDPAGIMFVDIAPFSKMSLERSEYFYYVKEWNSIPTILSAPFSLWATDEKYNKGEDNKAIIGFHLKHLLAVTKGRNPFDIDLSLLNAKSILIKDIATFDKYMDIIDQKNLICTDVEGISLAVVTNRLLTVQIGFWHRGKIKTIVIPWRHFKFFTWDKKDFAYIKKRLRKVFMREDVENVMSFGQFDIGQLCHELKMEIFPNKIYDIPAAEFAIDENHKFLQKMYKSGDWDEGYKPYALEFVEYRYGIFRPGTMVIRKEDRKNMEKFTLEEITEYGGFDVASPLLIREAQLQQCTDKYVGHKTQENFLTLVHHQLGIMIKSFALLKNTGIPIDIKHAKNLVAPGNVFTKTKDELRKKLLLTKNGKKANERLLRDQGLDSGSSGGMFSSTKAEILTLTKPKHLKTLFFDIMKLDPVKLGKTLEGSTDKGFQSKYKDIEEVKLFSHFNKVKTLKSTFADGINKIIVKNKDLQFDGNLRPILGFLYVLTGRLSSTDINSQNIPTRSDEDFEIHKELVKAIKAVFIAGPGRTMLGSDFSAHEVRMSGVISKDPGIREAFLKANEAIRKFRLTPNQFVEAAAAILALEGDIHIVNVRFFFKQDVDKSHPLRYKIKAIVFGVLYGKLAKGLAKELKIEVSEAQSLIDIMFERWHDLKDWIDNTHKVGKESYLVNYPNLRVAHMWGYMHDDIWAHRAMDRRAVNYPIQGFSSDIGVTSVYAYKKWVYYNITRKGYVLDSKHVNVVHDAQYQTTKFEHLPFAIYLVEHSMSTLPMDYYKEYFGYDINIPLSYGLEFGKDWASLNDWNFRVDGYNATVPDKVTKEPTKKYIPGLLDMIRDEGKRLDINSDPVIEDTKYIMNIRSKELEKDPYKMLVTDNTIARCFERMNMFKDQVE